MCFFPRRFMMWHACSLSLQMSSDRHLRSCTLGCCPRAASPALLVRRLAARRQTARSGWRTRTASFWTQTARRWDGVGAAWRGCGRCIYGTATWSACRRASLAAVAQPAWLTCLPFVSLLCPDAAFAAHHHCRGRRCHVRCGLVRRALRLEGPRQPAVAACCAEGRHCFTADPCLPRQPLQGSPFGWRASCRSAVLCSSRRRASEAGIWRQVCGWVGCQAAWHTSAGVQPLHGPPPAVEAARRPHSQQLEAHYVLISSACFSFFPHSAQRAWRRAPAPSAPRWRPPPPASGHPSAAQWSFTPMVRRISFPALQKATAAAQWVQPRRSAPISSSNCARAGTDGCGTEPVAMLKSAGLNPADAFVSDRVYTLQVTKYQADEVGLPASLWLQAVHACGGAPAGKPGSTRQTRRASARSTAALPCNSACPACCRLFRPHRRALFG